MRKIDFQNLDSVSENRRYAFLLNYDSFDRSYNTTTQLAIQDTKNSRWVITGGSYINWEARTLKGVLAAAIKDTSCGALGRCTALYEFRTLWGLRKWIRETSPL